MYYTIHHLTEFEYSAPITENVMEVRMQPRSEGIQRCLTFDLSLRPRAKVLAYRDYYGNVVHHFDIPAQHKHLRINAEAIVEVKPALTFPDSLEPGAWEAIDALAANNDHWDMLLPSQFARPTELLRGLGRELNVLQRRDDPLSLLRELTAAIYNTFEYVPQSTKVDSPIDDALTMRKGVCQDYSHVMIALVRELGIPCRYVSGYLFHRTEGDRSAEDATHAWIEALLPELGWVGFDPTNNLIAEDRHIRAAVGRDYADVPPTRGVFRGSADSELSVAVQVVETEELPDKVNLLPMTAIPWATPERETPDTTQHQSQQQQ